MSTELISYAWLKDVGFRCRAKSRGTNGSWRIWISEELGSDDLGLELAVVPGSDSTEWNCWLGNASGRFERFLRMRPMRTQGDVIRLVEGLSGLAWEPAHHLYGIVLSEARAVAFLNEQQEFRRFTKEYRRLADGPPVEGEAA